MQDYSRVGIRLILTSSVSIAILAAAAGAQETYGPPNLLKTMATPFGPPQSAPASATPAGDAPGHRDAAGQGEISLPAGGAGLELAVSPGDGGRGAGHNGSGVQRLRPRSLSERLIQSRLYLPGRLILGKPAEFTLKAPPGSYMAMAMADRDSGAKPVYGHALRLGPDRKVVAVGQVPENGLYSFYVETPIQGDLIGQYLFFEAAVWTKQDFSDVHLCVPVTSEGEEGIHNGVKVAAEAEHKGRLKFVPASNVPLQYQDKGIGGSGGL